MSENAKELIARTRYYSMLSGAFQKLPSRKPHPVRFISMLSYDNSFYRLCTRLIAYSSLLLLLGFEIMLFNPAHWIIKQQPGSGTPVTHWVMLVSLMLLQVFAIIGVLSATRSTLKARNPIPVRPLKNLRVAFVTTRAPGEPIDMVRTTLQAAKKVSHQKGKLDVWLLDETGDDQLWQLCIGLGVRYFSRNGITNWSTVKTKPRLAQRCTRLLVNYLMGPAYAKAHRPARANLGFAARSKHGNFNAWLSYLNHEHITYDVLAGVDTDQVPVANYLQRTLGYFRDPDVAYVVGPQVYGNTDSGLVARWAESQASFFQSTVQRAGNATASAMFVGTNYVVRMSALQQVGGFQPCITEDMATGLAIHASRNLATGQRWKSVYTPDVLAIGVGPEYWAPYFSQQWRWAAGSFDTWKRQVGKHIFKVSAGSRLHYLLMLTYYPLNALTWLLGIISSMIYLLTGTTAILAPWDQFVSLYLMTTVMQMSLYFWNRRHGVSPFDNEGTYGVPGMVMSILTAPIYLSALVSTVIGKKAHFVVTNKDAQSNPDGLATFKIHLGWAALLVAGLLYGFQHGHHHPAMLAWTAVLLLVCLLPPVLGLCQVLRGRFAKPVPNLVLTGDS